MHEVCIALLRGINVGGRNKLPMAQLRTIVEGIGGLDVRTYIQSGNVVFTAPQSIARRAATTLSDALEREAGISSPVTLRTAEEMQEIVASNPYLVPGQDQGHLHVGFLADQPSAAAVAGLDPDRSPQDEFTVRGREIYLRCPNGLARTKLTNAYFDSRLETTSTVRNWRTTLKLLAMAQG